MRTGILYATTGDIIEQFKNKHGETEDRTVEGPTAIKDVEVFGPDDFKAKYDAIQALYPGSIVRFQREPK